jgi:hypothetical protein
MLEASVEVQVLTDRLVLAACVHDDRLGILDRAAQVLGQLEQPPLEFDDAGQVADDDVRGMVFALGACAFVVRSGRGKVMKT